MARECDYSVAKRIEGTLSLNRTTEPFAGTVALIRPVSDRRGAPSGWRLKPLVTMQGAKSKIWATAAEAIASTKLMTLAAAKRAIEHASSIAAGGTP